ncbi:chromate transporter [Haloferula helveola]|uniref:Chromate transporter n=1 Tax=Haloferula helveola TaxID=490095 RepID=A0ABM7RBP5_9BACT|nr:chromate transporter [Haloferula helveola]
MQRPLGEIFTAFLKLGLISFGGPVAHLGYFHEEFVVRRKWLNEEAYADLVALCQFLPGPASSQVVFALGLRRGGLPGGLIASLCFTLPSAMLLILFALGVSSLGEIGNAGWLQGLKLAAVAVVAHAVVGMATKLCPDWPRRTLALVLAAALLSWPGVVGQLGAIGIGATFGWIVYRRREKGNLPAPGPAASRSGAIALTLFAILLIGLPFAAIWTDSAGLTVFDRFYRAGSLVFGGGHVVLPLLRAEVVPPGWIRDESFLAGYGAAQAVPGPLFTFAAYLGAGLEYGPSGWGGGLLCLVAIFLPALLLVGGALPFWELLRARPEARAALTGTNAAVVGILLAAFVNPVWMEGVRGAVHFGIALAAFAALTFAKAPSWLVVVGCAGVGAALL